MPPPPHPSSHLLTGGTNECLKLNLRQLGSPPDVIALLNGSNGHNSGPRMRGNVGGLRGMRSEESQMFHQALLVNAAAQCFLWDLLPPPPSRLRGSDSLRSATAAPSVKNSDVRRRHPASPTAIKFQYAGWLFNFAAQQSCNPTERSGEVAAADLAAQLSVASRLRVDETFTLSWRSWV